MQQGGAHGQAVAFFHQKDHDLRRKGGKRCESAQKSGHQQQAPDQIKLGHGLKNGEADADQVAADQIGCQGTPGDHAAGRQPQPQAPSPSQSPKPQRANAPREACSPYSMGTSSYQKQSKSDAGHGQQQGVQNKLPNCTHPGSAVDPGQATARLSSAGGAMVSLHVGGDRGNSAWRQCRYLTA